MDTKTVGSQIRQCRKMKGLTQEELAKETGLSTMSIRRYESGQRIVAEETLRKIASALGVTTFETLGITLSDIPTEDLLEELGRRAM